MASTSQTHATLDPFFDRFLKHRLLSGAEETSLARLTSVGPIGRPILVRIKNDKGLPRSCRTGTRSLSGRTGKAPVRIMRPKNGDTLFGVCHLAAAFDTALPKELVPTGVEIHVFPRRGGGSVACIPLRHDPRWGWYARWNSKRVRNGEYRLVLLITDTLAAAATDILMSFNYRFVLDIARKFLWSGIDLEDLFSAGVIGLKTGIEKFDPDRGYRLCTYVVWWIRQAIYYSVQQSSRTVRIPNQQWERHRRIREAFKRFGDDAALSKVAEYVADRTGKNLDPTAIAETIGHFALQVQPEQFVIDQGTDFSVYEGTADDRPDQIDILCSNEERTLIKDALCILPEREQDILKRRFGIDRDGDEETLQEIGKRYSISRERVRQIEGSALKKLRAHIAKTHR